MIPLVKDAKENSDKKKIKKLEFRINLSPRNILLGFLVLMLGLSFLSSVLKPGISAQEVDLSQALIDVKDNKIKQILIDGDRLLLTYNDGKQLISLKEPGESLVQTFQTAGIDPKSVYIKVMDQSVQRIIAEILGTIFPIILFAVFFYFIFRQARGAQDSIFSFGQSRAKVFAKGKQAITFGDVAGVDEAKEELKEVVDFLKHPQKYNALGARTPKGVLLIGPSGVGKCVTGDTIVWTNKGLMEIREIPRYYFIDPKSHQAYGAGVAGFDTEKILSVNEFASHWYDLGEQKTIKIRLDQGFCLEGTREHPVVVMDCDGNLRFRQLDQIKQGDYVAVQFGREMFGNLQIVDKDTAYLMGILTGDGNMSHSSRVGLTNIDPEVINFFKDYVHKRFPKSAITVREQSFLVANWNFKKILYDLGMSYLLSFDKTIPPTITQAPKETQVSFLQGLFDTDASVEKNRATFEYTTVSEKMARQVHMMLLNLGIVASLNIKGKPENGYYRSVYRITMTGTAFVDFYKAVGFRLTRKQKLLKEHVAQMGRVNTNVDVIPGIAKKVEESWRELSNRRLSKEKLSKTIDKVRRRTRISRQTFRDYVNYALETKADPPYLEDFRNLLEAKLFFSPVVEKLDSIARVYDFTVPDSHGFLGNGMINHNTLLAKAVAGEAGVPFFSMAGSEFMEMLVGVGASVTGDTPILTKKDGQVKLLPISELVDSYCKQEEADRVVPVLGLETLGFKKKETGFWGSQSKISGKSVFEGSCWQSVSGVFRHKVKEIYEIHFLDGMLRTTKDHSVFVRNQGYIHPKRVDELKPGEVLVNLPMNTRRWDGKLRKTAHNIKAHLFSTAKEFELDFWNENPRMREHYAYAMTTVNQVSSYQVGREIGVSASTVMNWRNEKYAPQVLSRKLVKLVLPDQVKTTPKLMKLFGLYTAEGRADGCLEFTFGKHEPKLIQDCIDLMKEVFGLKDNPTLRITDDNSVRVIFYSHHLGRFFSRVCGNGCHNKHVPSFLWDLSKEHFLAYLEGWSQGDGYETKNGKLSVTSVSKQLILEMAWLCSMHGIKAGIKHEFQKGGRIIKSKALPDLESWNLIIGKTSNPFTQKEMAYPYQIKRCIIKEIVKKPFNGYVYDLCGVKNEAFFGGEKPILLHNSRVRDLFGTAKKAAPAIIFIDEIDAIGRQRGSGFMGGHDEREQTLNQILVEMDGFTPNDNVMVIAATNRGDLLDSALLRPGRFDRTVVLEMPDLEGRKAILQIHAKGKHFAKGVSWEKMAKRTVGFSGADLENMLNEAAILAARFAKKEIDEADIEEAAVKVKLGPERKRLQSDEDKKMTAYHEAGHAVVSYFSPQTDPVHRISIVARGISLGHTLIAPLKDRSHETKTRLLEQINVMMGGRAAEELIFSEMTTGAANDISQATRIARAMVIDFGMSSLGPIFLGNRIAEDEGRMFYEPNTLSPEMQAKIDAEVTRITGSAYKKAQEILLKNRKKLDKIAERLLEKETIEEEEFEKLMR